MSPGAVTNPANDCVHEDGGATFTKHRTDQYTFAAGANLSGVVGIDLSAQTGWSTNVQASMQAPATNAVRLCGLKDAPAGNPNKLQFIPLA
jgi:hypothetical protein